MKSQRYVKAIIYLTVLVWTVVLLLNHEALKTTWLAPLSTVTSVVLILVMLFDLWGWKLPFLQGWFVKRPAIDGTWKVRLISNYKNPETGAAIPPIEAYMVVRQTLSTLSLRLLTKESTSELIGAEIVSASDGLYSVGGVYRNEPRFQVRHRSEMGERGPRVAAAVHDRQMPILVEPLEARHALAETEVLVDLAQLLGPDAEVGTMAVVGIVPVGDHRVEAVVAAGELHDD